ncbi:MAG TPA: hypothetical protein VEC36_03995 [Patescibacteria group bacterium]|nr:hypothetical protein [Patescibacteria group bacterium]
MKNLFSLLAIVIFIILGTGCSEDNTTGNDNTSTGNSVTAKKNGVAWKADINVTAIKTTNNQITINASSGMINREVLILNIMNAASVGDHTMTKYGTGTSATFSRVNPDEGYASIDANSGSLKITKLTDTRIEGTFNVTVKQGESGPGVINFTEGKFGADLK